MIRTRPSLFDVDPCSAPESSRGRSFAAGADASQTHKQVEILDPVVTRTRPHIMEDSEYRPPSYKGSVFEKWARAYIQKNLWRAQVFIDQQDLEQEAAIKYWRISRRYSASLRSAAHLMCLFKSSLANLLTSEARKTRIRIKTVSLEGEKYVDL